MCVLAVYLPVSVIMLSLSWPADSRGFILSVNIIFYFFKLWFYGKLHAKVIFIIKARYRDSLEFLLGAHAALLDSRNSWYLGEKQFGI